MIEPRTLRSKRSVVHGTPLTLLRRVRGSNKRVKPDRASG